MITQYNTHYLRKNSFQIRSQRIVIEKNIMTLPHTKKGMNALNKHNMVNAYFVNPFHLLITDIHQTRIAVIQLSNPATNQDVYGMNLMVHTDIVQLLLDIGKQDDITRIQVESNKLVVVSRNEGFSNRFKYLLMPACQPDDILSYYHNGGQLRSITAITPKKEFQWTIERIDQ